VIKLLKQELCDTSRLIYDRGLVWCTGGNISIRIPHTNTFLITPSGFNKGLIKPNDLITINASGETLEGRDKPSIEVNMHLIVYQEKPEINAIIHAHPPVATTLTTLGFIIIPFTPEGKIFIEKIGRVDYFPAGSPELVKAVKSQLRDTNIILLKNHGALTFDHALLNAYYRMEEIENTAKMNLIAYNLGKKIPII